MRIYFTRQLLILLLSTGGVLCLVVPAVTAGPNYGAPLVLPGATTAADPSAIRVDDIYYVYATTDTKTVQGWSSADLMDWQPTGAVWGPPPPGAWNDDLIMAPQVLPYEERFYLYYGVGHYVGVAVADTPTGPFVDVYEHPFFGGIYTGDPAVFQDEDGSLFMYCTCLAPFSSIRVLPMSDPVTLTGECRLLLVPGLLNWEGFLVEGPWMIKRAGTYYLMYSGFLATLPWYAIGYATAADPRGPFTKYDGNPILQVDWAYDFWGPGHNSSVTSPDGRILMFYHTKTEPASGWDREIRINELAFTTDKELYVVLGDDDDSTDDDAVNDDITDDDAIDDDDTADDDAINDDTIDDDVTDDDATNDDAIDDDATNDDAIDEDAADDDAADNDDDDSRCGC